MKIRGQTIAKRSDYDPSRHMDNLRSSTQRMDKLKTEMSKDAYRYMKLREKSYAQSKKSICPSPKDKRS